MGKVVVANDAFVFLVASDADEIFVLPKETFEPDLSKQMNELCAINFRGIAVPDGQCLEYFHAAPWDSQPIKVNDKYSSIEETLRRLIISRLQLVKRVNRKIKSDLERIGDRGTHTNSARTGARQLICLLEAFSWVSKKYYAECHEIGNNRDFDFKIYEKSAISFLGKSGELVHQFRWSEFLHLEVIDAIKFEIFTIDGSWGAAMGRSGFPKRER